jgi:arabinan endo-1,5-alpha-L-arabinosidase
VSHLRLKILALLVCLSLLGCHAGGHSATLGAYPLGGNTFPVRDPSVIRKGGTYYLFATDAVRAGQTGFLPIRCSTDKISWNACGYVFPAMPSWVATVVPGARNLWAPDISYFDHLYHVYYAASTLGSQVSAIGLAINTTLDSASPAYHWVDQGAVLSSSGRDDFNALDPNILVDRYGAVWLTYGSFWTGFKQRRIDATTGKLSTSDTAVYALAGRPKRDHAIEGASLVKHGGYYYLFVSTGHCCQANYQQDDYREAVGRSTSPHGPFVDRAGVDMEAGGGTVLLAKSADWNAPGGGTAYIDQSGESLFVFHALRMGSNPTGYLWVKRISWAGDWPSLD